MTETRFVSSSMACVRGPARGLHHIGTISAPYRPPICTKLGIYNNSRARGGPLHSRHITASGGTYLPLL